MHGEHDDLGVGPEVANLLGSFDAVHDRHADVHEDQVGIQLNGLFDGFFSVCGLAADLPVGTVEESFDALADKFMVVDQKDSNGHLLFFVCQSQEGKVRRGAMQYIIPLSGSWKLGIPLADPVSLGFRAHEPAGPATTAASKRQCASVNFIHVGFVALYRGWDWFITLAASKEQDVNKRLGGLSHHGLRNARARPEASVVRSGRAHHTA